MSRHRSTRLVDCAWCGNTKLHEAHGYCKPCYNRMAEGRIAGMSRLTSRMGSGVRSQALAVKAPSVLRQVDAESAQAKAAKVEEKAARAAEKARSTAARTERQQERQRAAQAALEAAQATREAVQRRATALRAQQEEERAERAAKVAARKAETHGAETAERVVTRAPGDGVPRGWVHARHLRRGDVLLAGRLMLVTDLEPVGLGGKMVSAELSNGTRRTWDVDRREWLRLDV